MPFDPGVNAPYGASYAAPLMNFAGLAELPQDAFAATQRKRILGLQAPVVDPRTGQPTTDPHQILAAAMQRGGLEAALQQLPTLQRQNYLDFLQTPLPGQSGAAGNGQAGNSAAMGAAPQAPPQGQPQANVNTPNARPDEITMQGNGTFENPYLPQSRRDYEEIPDGAYYRASGSTAPVAKGYEGRRPPKDNAIEQPVEESASADNTKNNGTRVAGPPFARTASFDERFGANSINAPAGGPGSGAPAPVAGNPGPIAPPNARGESPLARVAQARPQVPVPTTSAIPETYRGREQQYIKEQENIAEAYRQRALMGEVNGFNTKAMLDSANAAQQRAQFAREELSKRGQTILESQLRSGEPTNEQKLATESGVGTPLEYERNKDLQKAEIDRSTKTYAGMQAQAAQYERDMKPYLDVSRSLLNDPSMYTGAGSPLALMVNRVRSMFGEQKAAMLQEALQKVTATSVLGQINLQKDQMQEAGGTSGRIFAQQVALVEKAAPALSTTPGGNRFLIEVSSRMGELSRTVRDKAIEYTRDPRHPYLDKGFDAMVSEYMNKHPIFSKDELSHPELLGAPTIPPDMRSKQEIGEWARNMKLASGDAVRTPDGRYVPAGHFMTDAAGR